MAESSLRPQRMFRRPKTEFPSSAEPNPAPAPNQALLGALRKIVEIAGAATGGSGQPPHRHDSVHDARRCPSCAGPKPLPARLLISAANTATRVNPVNAPAYWRSSATRLGFDPKPEYISALTSKYWGPKPRELSVSFMEDTEPELRQRILSHMNAWTKTGCISFAETSGDGQVRISRQQGGYWSYLGTDILHIPANRQTMNLEGFTMDTEESEYRRVVRHETGHTLGFPHEHMRGEIIARIDRAKIYDYALETFGWDKATVDAQILTPIDEATLLPGSTPADQLSIMCYQLPASVTIDGEPILGGTDIDKTDYEFCGLIYPRPAPAGVDPAHADSSGGDAWPSTEDVVPSL